MKKDILSNQNNHKKGENVLVWLDFDTYAYINFGIISALSKLDKFNFIGIVTTPQDINFFQNQQIIQFKKLLYYPECYVGKSTYDMDNLKNIEKKYDLNIWLNIFAERSFYKYWTEFHKFTREEILTIIDNTITFFVETFEKYQPKLVLMQQAGENISNLLLYQLAKKIGIRILMPNQLYLKNRIIMSDNLISREVSDEFKKLLNNFNDSSETYDTEFIKKQDRSESINILLNSPKFKQSFLQRINYYRKRLLYNPEPIYKDIGKTRLKMIKHRVQNMIEANKRKRFLDANSLTSIKDTKFLYYPLSSEPEARILTTSPFYTNQLMLIENIAKSLPIDFVLYVKEHPVQKLKFWRPISDYKKIIDIPNVRLVHPDVHNLDLISQSQGVIAISGGTAFEAIFHKKPVILFADEYYDVLSMVTKIQTFDTLPFVIKNALLNFKFSNKEFNAFMQAFNEQSLPIPYHSMMTDGSIVSSVQKYEHNHNLTLQHFLQFYEKHKNHFELIAQTIHSKLKIQQN
ncbi:MAG: hypothetical protein QXN55_03210 [Candidatus Nitrosotenuis sp.]